MTCLSLGKAVADHALSPAAQASHSACRPISGPLPVAVARRNCRWLRGRGWCCAALAPPPRSSRSQAYLEGEAGLRVDPTELLAGRIAAEPRRRRCTPASARRRADRLFDRRSRPPWPAPSRHLARRRPPRPSSDFFGDLARLLADACSGARCWRRRDVGRRRGSSRRKTIAIGPRSIPACRRW